MKDEEKDEKLISLLAVRRSDVFWARQKTEIMSIATQKHVAQRAWLLAPVLGMAALLVMVMSPRAPRQLPADGDKVVNTAFIEHLDMLADMDVLEAVPEEEL